MAQLQLISVPAHNEHTGPDDGSECVVCDFYRKGYWLSVDQMLDDRNRQWHSGKTFGKWQAEREQRQADNLALAIVVGGILLGIFLRVIVESQRPADGTVQDG